MYGDKEEEMSNNYFINHFRGNHSLGLSYWINGLVISNILSFMMIGLVESIDRDGIGLQASAALTIILIVCSMLVWFWGSAGIWRSANKHIAKSGSSLWANLAQVSVSISAFAMLGNLIGTSRSVLDISQLAVGNDSMGEAAGIKVEGDNLFLDGPITLGVSDKFKATLKANPNITSIYLSSLGGRVREGRILATQIKEKGLNTVAYGICASSCTIAFLAGSERILDENGRLGFHSPSGIDISDAEARQGDVDMRISYEEASLPPAFIQRAIETPSSTVWNPSIKELIDARVITRLSPKWVAAENRQTEINNNKIGPQKLDGLTTLINTKANGPEITYTYKINGQSSEFSRNAVKMEMERSNKKLVCSQPGSKMMVNSGAILNYDYKDLSGDLIARAIVDKC